MDIPEKDYEKKVEETPFESHNNHVGTMEVFDETINLEPDCTGTRNNKDTALLKVDKDESLKSKTSEEDIISTIIGIILTLFFGLLVAAILDSFIGYKCPNCNHTIIKDSEHCDYCNTSLRWD